MGNQTSNIEKSKEEIEKEVNESITNQEALAEYLKISLIKLPKILNPISSKKQKYLKYKQKYLRLKKLLDIN